MRGVFKEDWASFLFQGLGFSQSEGSWCLGYRVDEHTLSINLGAEFVAASTEVAKRLCSIPCRTLDFQELGGSWDLVTRVIIKVTVRITTYNPT